MRLIWILLLLLFPLSLIGQDLICCESVKKVETYLNGNWEKRDSDLNKLYQFKFISGVGEAKIFTIDSEGTLTLVENSKSVIRVLKTENGFKLEYDWEGLKTYSRIVYLDSKRLTLTRRDGKESIMYRTSE